MPDRDDDGVGEGALWQAIATRQERAELLPQRGHGAGIEPWRRGLEPEQLEECAQVLGRGFAGEALSDVADVGTEVHDLAGEPPPQRGGVEGTVAALVDNRGRKHPLEDILVGQQGQPTRTVRRHLDLVGLERGRLDEDTDAIGEPPVSQSKRAVGGFRDDPPRRRRIRHQVAGDHLLGPGRQRGSVGAGDDREQFGSRWQPGLGSRWSLHRNKAIDSPGRRTDRRVDLGRCDGRKQSLIERVLVVIADRHGPSGEGTEICADEAPGVALLGVLVGGGLRVVAEQVGLGALELRRQNTVQLESPQLAEHGLEGFRGLAVLGRQAELGGLDVANQRRRAKIRPRKRSFRAASHVRETLAGNLGEELVEELVPVICLGAVAHRRPPDHQGDTLRAELGVGDDHHAGAGNFRHGRLEARPWRGRSAQVAEPTREQGLERVHRIIANGNDPHQVGAIPVPIETLDRARVGVADDRGVANWEPSGVARSLEEDREFLVPHAAVGAKSVAPLAKHHTALVHHGGGIEGHPGRPILQDFESHRDELWLVARHRQDIGGLVEPGRGIEVGPEADPDRLEVLHQVVLGEMGRAIERHVLDKMCQATLILVLEDGAGPDHQPQLEPLLGVPVAANPVPEAIGELAGVGGGIDRKWRGGNRPHSRALSDNRKREHETSEDQQGEPHPESSKIHGMGRYMRGPSGGERHHAGRAVPGATDHAAEVWQDRHVDSGMGVSGEHDNPVVGMVAGKVTKDRARRTAYQEWLPRRTRERP